MTKPQTRWPRTIGIVGGLGPFAHLRLEEEILRASGATGDQEYPPWVLVSAPQTPDRTAALLAGGESPVPSLLAALDALAERADFAVIACNSAHAFLRQLRERSPLPLLDMVAETVRAAAVAGHRRLGLLATTGCLEARVYPLAAARVAPGIEIVALTDLPGGTERQQELVMRAIYGDRGVDWVGLKAGGGLAPESLARNRALLSSAVAGLVAAGAEAVVLGCTEIPLALGADAHDGIPLIDPMRVAARAAVEIAAGRRELP